MIKLLLIILLVPTLVSAEPYIIGVDDGNGPEVVEASTRLVARLAEKTGYKLEAKPFPSLRLKDMLVKGRIDGAMPNSEKVFEGYHKKIVKVPYAVMRTHVYAYSARPLTFTRLKDISKLRYLKVAGLLATNSLVSAEKIDALEVQGVDKALSMIALNRADVVLIPDIFARRFLKQNPQQAIVENRPLIAHIDAYLWLSNKNESLVPALNKAIGDLDRAGELESLFGTSWDNHNSQAVAP